MKLKTLLLSALLLLCGMAHADDLARVMLMHQGQTTFFTPDKISEAMNQAVEGDTILLSEGKFPGFIVTKPVLVRGTGSYTDVEGTININIPNNPVLTLPVLEGLEAYDLNITQSCTNLHIRKCYFFGFTNSAVSTPNALIERCKFGGTFQVSQHMTDFNVRNTYIAELDGANKRYNFCNFVNCHISGGTGNASGRFINCTIWGWSGIASSTLIKTLVYTNKASVATGTVAQDCYYDATDSTYGTSTLMSKGYLGLDGTIVGPYGGVNPYDNSFRPGIPREIDGTIGIDNENKKLKVEMEISPN